MGFFKKKKNILPPAEDHIEANLANSTVYVRDLQKIYPSAKGDVQAMKDVNINVMENEFVSIVGPSGCGKSTLLHYLYQKLSQKTDLTIGYMPQRYDTILPLDLSPIAFLSKTGDKSEREVISSHLANLNFSHDEMNHAISDLSGGQKGKLLLLHLVLEAPQLLILDEPTRNFSPTSQPQVRQLFENYPGAILTVSHDVNYLRQVCQKIYRLDAHGLEEVEI